VGLSVLALIGVGLWLMQPDATPVRDVVVAKQESAVVQETPEVPDGWTVVGGIARPATDTKTIELNGEVRALPAKVLHGFSPPVSPDANPQVAAVFASLKDRSNPNAFSSFAAPKVFDPEAFKADPQAFINEVDPSRVFNPLQPGDGVPVIQPVGGRYHGVKQGEAVTLSVNAIAGAPVCFCSFNLGSFSNQLTSQTVLADDSGVAKAEFTATGGTIEDVRILAASPMTSGQVTFTVNVQIGG
jgi:hypothetical protein